MAYSELPQIVENNLEQIQDLDTAQTAALINLRAGRVAETTVTADAVINQFNLIESELLEGKKAAAEGDLNQVRDAVADIVLLAFGQQGVIGGLDLDSDYKRMCAFNMTRIPKTLEEAELTVEKYNKIGIQTQIHPLELNRPDLGLVGTLYPVRTIDQEQWDTEKGEHFAPNKFVKSVYFQDVFYDDIPEVSITPTASAKAKVGNLLTKEMVQAIKSKAIEKHGTHGTIPTRLFNEVLDNLIGQRF